MRREEEGIKRVCLSPGGLTSHHQIVIPDHWSTAADKISQFQNHQGKGEAGALIPPIVLICGAKNVGKSTFGRFLINTLLNRYKYVGYLDTDSGQPEYTPPGCVSFHIINKQTPDLAIPCMRTPERCFFYGDTSPKSDPQAYVKCVFKLYDYFRREHYQEEVKVGKTCMPLVVNTPGWIKGIGYDALVDILRYTIPTHVVQIRLSVSNKNLPVGAFWLSHDQEDLVDLINIDAARQDSLNRSVIVQKHGRLLRELRMIAYFKQCFPADSDISTYKQLAYALASLPPYEVPISRMRVLHLHSQVPETETFYSLNASIVGLAMSSEGSSSTPLCSGLGIVRGIDVVKGLYYVLTPVPIAKLAKVDVFLQGSIEIPTCLLQARGCTSPYISSNFLSGTRVTRQSSPTHDYTD